MTHQASHRTSPRRMANANDRWTRVAAYLQRRGLAGATATRLAHELELNPKRQNQVVVALQQSNTYGLPAEHGFVGFHFPSPGRRGKWLYVHLDFVRDFRAIQRLCQSCRTLKPITEFALYWGEDEVSHTCATCAQAGVERSAGERSAVRSREKRRHRAEAADDRGPRRRLVVCKLCCDLPHARPDSGCPVCGKPCGELPVAVVDGYAGMGCQGWTA